MTAPDVPAPDAHAPVARARPATYQEHVLAELRDGLAAAERLCGRIPGGDDDLALVRLSDQAAGSLSAALQRCRELLVARACDRAGETYGSVAAELGVTRSAVNRVVSAYRRAVEEAGYELARYKTEREREEWVARLAAMPEAERPTAYRLRRDNGGSEAWWSATLAAAKEIGEST